MHRQQQHLCAQARLGRTALAWLAESNSFYEQVGHSLSEISVSSAKSKVRLVEVSFPLMVLKTKVQLCSPGWPGTQLFYLSLPSAGLQVCPTMIHLRSGCWPKCYLLNVIPGLVEPQADSKNSRRHCLPTEGRSPTGSQERRLAPTEMTPVFIEQCWRGPQSFQTAGSHHCELHLTGKAFLWCKGTSTHRTEDKHRIQTHWMLC